MRGRGRGTWGRGNNKRDWDHGHDENSERAGGVMSEGIKGGRLRDGKTDK